MPCCWRTAGSPSVAGCWSSGPRSVSSPRCWWSAGGGATVALCRTWNARGERCGRRWSRSGSCCTASIWTTDDALVSVPVVFHPATRLHNPGPGHPERPERIEAVLAALRAPDLTGTVEWVEGQPAARDQLERVHSPVYLDALERVAHGGGGALDPATVMSRDSWAAALAAPGVAIGAVEQGIERGSAFGATRPPRHHALAGRAMGVCLINNVVGAARAAQERWRRVGRVHARARRRGALDGGVSRARRAGAGRRCAGGGVPARPARRRRTGPRARACVRVAASRYYSRARDCRPTGVQTLACQHLSAARRGGRARPLARPAARDRARG